MATEEGWETSSLEGDPGGGKNTGCIIYCWFETIMVPKCTWIILLAPISCGSLRPRIRERSCLWHGQIHSTFETQRQNPVLVVLHGIRSSNIWTNKALILNSRGYANIRRFLVPCSVPFDRLASITSHLWAIIGQAYGSLLVFKSSLLRIDRIHQFTGKLCEFQGDDINGARRKKSPRLYPTAVWEHHGKIYAESSEKHSVIYQPCSEGKGKTAINAIQDFAETSQRFRSQTPRLARL
jgi:hypothetical protein